jgi:hypothetical protein
MSAKVVIVKTTQKSKVKSIEQIDLRFEIYALDKTN